MAKRDSVGPREESLGARIEVPAGEEGRVRIEGLPGLEPVSDEDKVPTRPKPADIVFTVRQAGTKGIGIFVATQKAPLTLSNRTWYESQEQAEAALEDFKEQHGWSWLPAQYEWHDEDGEPYENPNGDMVTPKVRVKGEMISEGYWTNTYHLVFDPASLVELAKDAK